MVTDSLVHKKFVHDTLHRGISKIYATQESVVRSNYQIRSGRLLTSLSIRSYRNANKLTSSLGFLCIVRQREFLMTDLGLRTTSNLHCTIRENKGRISRIL